MATDFVSNVGHTAPLVAGAALLIFASLHDIAARTIPNFVSVLLALLGFGLRSADGQLLTALALGAIVFCVCMACWLRGWMGGGDVKLLAAAAVFVPPATVGNMIVATTLFGGVVGLIYLAARTIARASGMVPRATPRIPGQSSPLGFLKRVLRAEHWRLLRGSPLPYASAIAAGVLFVTLSG
jgi:prepilin peptidase CpaA